MPKEDYSDSFDLTPLDAATFQLAMEDWEIWKKWESAYKSGQTDISTHPALPQDASRHAELKKILDNVLRIDPQRAIKRTAQFEVLGDGNLPGACQRP